MTPRGKTSQGTGIYIHIPFCSGRCHYCTFFSCEDPSYKSIYQEYILAEIDELSAVYEKHFKPYDTVYIGGGTPGTLPVFAVDEILARIRTSFPAGKRWPEMEVTIEMNPEDADVETFKIYRQLGINRISIGTQRMKDELLQLLGRRHTVEQNREAVKAARAAGFKNLNLDMIAGLPGDTPEAVAGELDELLKLKPEHMSIYFLELKEGAAMSGWGDEVFPSEDTLAEIYEKINGMMNKAGFEHYEISNYARSGKNSAHNMKYWSGGSWLGLGLSSSSNSGKARWKNPTDWDEYYRYIISIPYDFPSGVNYISDPGQIMEDEFFMSLRKTEGIDLDAFKTRWGKSLLEGNEELIEEYMEKGYLRYSSDKKRLAFTEEGMFISNTILTSLLNLE